MASRLRNLPPGAFVRPVPEPLVLNDSSHRSGGSYGWILLTNLLRQWVAGPDYFGAAGLCGLTSTMLVMIGGSRLATCSGFTVTRIYVLSVFFERMLSNCLCKSSSS